MLKGTSLSCSPLGFGAYRVGGGEHEASHARALRAAIRAGVNFIDTSSHYSAAAAADKSKDNHGASERFITQVLADAARTATPPGMSW